MNFQELKSSYLKETVPLKKIQLIESVSLHFKKEYYGDVIRIYRQRYNSGSYPRIPSITNSWNSLNEYDRFSNDLPKKNKEISIT